MRTIADPCRRSWAVPNPVVAASAAVS
jgi:hypothetical protein